MFRDIDISLLRAFVAVVETGSVTGAARLLNRTQAAVSQQIKRLEELFGTELFQREHKRISLASDGERLLTHARRLLSLNDETWGMMTTPNFQGEVRMGVPIDLVARYMPSILRRFHSAWPHVRVSIETGNSDDLVAKLETGDLDLTLSTDLEAERPCETLYRDHLVWVGSQNGSAHLQRPLPIAIGGARCRFRPCVLEALREANIDWRNVIEITNEEAKNATVSAGISVTPLLLDSIPNNLAVIGPGHGLPELPDFDINLHLPRSGTNELAEELARHVRAEFAARYRNDERRDRAA